MKEEDRGGEEEGEKGFVQGVGFKRETGRYDIRNEIYLSSQVRNCEVPSFTPQLQYQGQDQSKSPYHL